MYTHTYIFFVTELNLLSFPDLGLGYRVVISQAAVPGASGSWSEPAAEPVGARPFRGREAACGRDPSPPRLTVACSFRSESLLLTDSFLFSIPFLMSLILLKSLQRLLFVYHTESQEKRPSALGDLPPFC